MTSKCEAEKRGGEGEGEERVRKALGVRNERSGERVKRAVGGEVGARFDDEEGCFEDDGQDAMGEEGLGE